MLNVLSIPSSQANGSGKRLTSDLLKNTTAWGHDVLSLAELSPICGWYKDDEAIGLVLAPLLLYRVPVFLPFHSWLKLESVLSDLPDIEVSKQEVPRSLPGEGVPHDDQSIWPSICGCNPAPVFTHTQARNGICVALGKEKQRSSWRLQTRWLF